MNVGKEQLNRRAFLKAAGRKVAAAALTAGSLILLGSEQPAYGGSFDDLDQYDFLIARVKFASDRRVLGLWNTNTEFLQDFCPSSGCDGFHNITSNITTEPYCSKANSCPHRFTLRTSPDQNANTISTTKITKSNTAKRCPG